MSSSTATRRRKQDRTKNSSSPKDDSAAEEHVEPMDEVEQDRHVEELRLEAKEQMELMHNIFSRICEGAMFLSLVLGVASQDVWCWIHVIGSIFMHWGATRVVAAARAQENEDSGLYKILPFVALLVVVGVFSYQYMTQDDPSISLKNRHVDDDTHHMALALANLVTMLAALYLRWDAKSTQQQILALEKSKYRYKSL